MIRVQHQFREGQLVRHRHHGYRGVVVAFDLHCRAADAWYQNNRTQPAREQPWYHVLVHGSAHATYAAQENLVADDSAEPIVHPQLAEFFGELRDGAYVRNDRRWVGWT